MLQTQDVRSEQDRDTKTKNTSGPVPLQHTMSAAQWSPRRLLEPCYFYSAKQMLFLEIKVWGDPEGDQQPYGGYQKGHSHLFREKLFSRCGVGIWKMQNKPKR